MSTGPTGHDPAAGPDPWRPLREVLRARVTAAFRERGIPVDDAWLQGQLDAEPQPPADLALALHRPAKAAGRRPDELAVELAGALDPMPGFTRVSASGAYVNLEADPDGLAEATLTRIAQRGARYGCGDPRPGKVSVEHTSANPTGPFHIGRVRNAVIGDTLVRVLRAAGFAVTAQYYVDDVGRQAATVTWVWSLPVDEWPAGVPRPAAAEPPPGTKEDLHFGAPYPAVSAYFKEHPDAGAHLQQLSRDLEAGREPPRHHEIVERILRGMVASLARIGIGYDEFVWESSFLHDGSVEGVIERLGRAPHAVREENGALAIDAGGYGLPKESARIIVTRGDGTSLYVTRDVAFHEQKFARFDRVVDVLGADHLLHARTLEALLTELGDSRRPEFVLYAYINAPGGGKMSTRGGTAIYLDDLLAEAVTRAREEVLKRRTDLEPAEIDRIAEKVATSAIRYSIARVAPEKTVQFRWEEALSFEGRSAPFLQYSYARASSLLRKAERTSGPYPFVARDLARPEERALIRSLSRLPGLVEYVARSGHVHALAGYAHSLAEEFNRFYNEVPVLRGGTAERESRIALVAAGRQALGNVLDLLGVEKLEQM
jgi:arginyl-tRNA synthetase